MFKKKVMVCCGNPEMDVKGEAKQAKKIRGTVELMKKNVLDVTDIKASVVDRFYELFGGGVSLQLISATHSDSDNKFGAKLGKPAYIENWITKITSVNAEDPATFSVVFDWDESMGEPGAFIIKNNHHNQFYLRTLTLEDVPGHGTIHFNCYSWIYPQHRYNYNRVFFSNKAYLPHQTPEPLRKYREEELEVLRGSGKGKLQEWDRVYDYDYYNDLGLPDKSPDHVRKVLGGTQHFPYPRRVRTGRKPTKKDLKSESRLHLLNLNIYVPKDERFSHVKFADFLAYSVKSLFQVLRPESKALFDKTINEFDSFQDVLDIYDNTDVLPNSSTLQPPKECIPWEFMRELVRNDGERFSYFPKPAVIAENTSAWMTDEEFAREMLAGVNPVIISCLQEFPPTSNLDPKQYGKQNSTITKEHIEKNMNGLTVEEAIKNKKLFILDHHDALMPYLARINSTGAQIYASRTLLLLEDDGTLKPLVIELSKPHPQGESHGADSEVYTPAKHGIEASVWMLAKAYVAVNDSGYHQLISHWLNSHAVIEPFIIATHRHLSVVHPIYKLLHPHFRDTMHINALARHTLINAGGILEITVFPGKYSMEMSAVIYKNWNFNEQALPADLLKRGVAVEDKSIKPHGLRLVIEDYPYAVDGLEIWSAINTWVSEYCSLYYPTDKAVEEDPELQSWWTEVRTKGHGDLKDEAWWPEMNTLSNLVQSCTIIIWLASAFHAAVNFGQYPYAGYLPNRPTVSRRFMPIPGSDDYKELESNFEKAYLKTITAQLQTLIGVSLIEILSRHSSDEVYLGQAENPNWTKDDQALDAFTRFGKELKQIEERITARNSDPRLKNRVGPVQVPYTLLYPHTSADPKKEAGLTGKGIPNSISI